MTAYSMSMDTRDEIRRYIDTGDYSAAIETARQERAWRKRQGYDTRVISRTITRLIASQQSH